MEANTDCPGQPKPLAVLLILTLRPGPPPLRTFKKLPFPTQKPNPAAKRDGVQGPVGPWRESRGRGALWWVWATPKVLRRNADRRKPPKNNQGGVGVKPPRPKPPYQQAITYACGSDSRTWAALPPGSCLCPPPRSPGGAPPHAPGCPSPGLPACPTPAAARRRL